MRIEIVRLWSLLTGAGLILCLCACAGTKTALDSQDHKTLLANDRMFAEQGSDTHSVIKLSVEDALHRGLAFNLDARVAALEALSQEDSITLAKLEALPKLETSAGYTGRNRDSASSSLSILSGRESLEPSISSERHRRIADLKANWDLIDAALALADGQKAKEESKIMAERYRKVIQNVQRDVYAAYWRAAAYQNAAERVKHLQSESKKQISNIETALSKKLISPEEASEQANALIERQRTLSDLQDQLSISDEELRGLLSLSSSAKLVLTSKTRPIDKDIRRLLDMPKQDLEWMALQDRPDLREEVLNRNLAIDDLRREVLSSFPGLSIFAGREFDTNRFLANQNWSSYSTSIVQNLANLLTLPVRYQASQNKQTLADAKRQALVAATLAQVGIARAQLELAEDSYAIAQKQAGFSQQKAKALSDKQAAGLTSADAALQAELDSVIENLRAGLAHAQVQESYANMINTLGQDLIPTTQLAEKDSTHGGAP